MLYLCRILAFDLKNSVGIWYNGPGDMMKKYVLRDALITVGILLAAFAANLLLLSYFQIRTVTPMIFVLGVFLISLLTKGYLWGVTASLLSVLAVNYAFTYPYYEFDLISPECLSAAAVMLIVSVVTGTMTTQLKQQEKMKAEAEKERMRADLLRAVSHDLRTPLTSIYGACSALREDLDRIPPDRQRKLLEEIGGDAQWLIRMVENLLSVTRLDGNVSIRKTDVVLEELVDAVLVKFHKHYPKQEVELTLPEEFVMVQADPMLLEQVLMNLLENAVFHAKDMRHLELLIELERDKVHFIVRDDGRGILPDRLPGLFTGSLDSRRPKDMGRSNMGIGLSVCAAIIRAHGGEITAENRKRGGAEFRFALDREEENEQ